MLSCFFNKGGKSIFNETALLDTLNFDVFVHTIQFLGNKTLPDAEIRIRTGGGNYVESNNKGRYKKVNPNHCGFEIQTLEDTEHAIDAMLHDLQINPEMFLLERFDLAVNTSVKFADPILYKLNLYLAALYATRVNTDNCYRICGADLVQRSIDVRKKGRSPILSIYNKNIESQGRNPANTRIEWRFVNQTGRLTMRETIEEFCNVLGKLPDYIISVNEQQTAALVREFERVKCLDYPDGRISDLPTFVKCHAADIFNKDILGNLHDHYYPERTRNWLRRYRNQSNNTLYLVGRGEIVAYIKCIKQAILQHLKTHSKTVSFLQGDYGIEVGQDITRYGFADDNRNLFVGNL